MPAWLKVISLASLILAACCAIYVAADILSGRGQKMAVMNAVWPLTALYMGPLGLRAYLAIGRERRSDGDREGDRKPGWRSVFKGTTHCGAGCTLGDFIGDWVVFWAGWSIAGVTLWPKMAGEFTFAFVAGIAFQYFSIVPMRKLAPLPGLWAAIKADTLSITAYELGMFVWMILTRFVFFGRDLPPTEPVYWFMMQIAMICGFATSYPMNAWLIRKGWKEAM